MKRFRYHDIVPPGLKISEQGVRDRVSTIAQAIKSRAGNGSVLFLPVDYSGDRDWQYFAPFFDDTDYDVYVLGQNKRSSSEYRRISSPTGSPARAFRRKEYKLVVPVENSVKTGKSLLGSVVYIIKAAQNGDIEVDGACPIGVIDTKGLSLSPFPFYSTRPSSFEEGFREMAPRTYSELVGAKDTKGKRILDYFRVLDELLGEIDIKSDESVLDETIPRITFSRREALISGGWKAAVAFLISKKMNQRAEK